jgi:hypothetical protein
MKWAHPLKGRTIKQTMADVLSERLGWAICEDDLWIQNPKLRQLDYAAWGYLATNRKQFCSWDSMSECLKYGFEFHDYEKDNYDGEISSKKQ